MHAPSSFRSHAAGLFLLSLATLLLELSLTRVLSVTLWYHFGFLVISTALLGFGVSGVMLAIWRSLANTPRLDLALSLFALGFSIAVVASFWCMQRIPFDPFALATDHRQLFFMPLYLIVVAVPFFFAGGAISLLLTRSGPLVNRLYAFDLLGAGLGCALVAWVMPHLGGSGSVLFSAFVGALAAILFAGRANLAPALISSFAAIGLLFASFHGDRVLPIHVGTFKARRTTTPIYSAWNIMSLVQVFDYPASKTEPSDRVLVIDAGTAATGINDLRPDVATVLNKDPHSADDPSRPAYLGREGARVLIIGSGAGSQVLQALALHASSVTAVEINPAINDIVANRMNDFWGGLFHRPEVHLVTDEGRSFVRRSQDTYDTIISVHTISNAAVASGALSLAENYVLTREAFVDYLNHLSPDGTLYFTRPEYQLPRLLATAREAFEQLGLGTLSNHVVLDTDPPAPGGRKSFTGGFLLKKSAFTAADLEIIRAPYNEHGRENIAAGNPWGAPHRVVLYAPDHIQPGSLYQQIVDAPDLGTVIRSTEMQLAPATDNKPFFNQHTRWTSIRWSTIRDMFSQDRPMAARLALEDRPVAEVTLLVLLVQTAIIAGLFILLPLLLSRGTGLQWSASWHWLIYFAALGLAFIMVEISSLQHFLLFLGQPIYTYAVVLASLLIFTGLGSFFSARWPPSVAVLRRVLPSIVVVIAVWSLLTPAIFHLGLGLPLTVRILIAVALVAPLGFVLGMPFPLGLRIAVQESAALGAWAWGVNGFFTVLGTVLALMLGMMAGFVAVLILACLCYGCAFFVMLSFVPATEPKLEGTPELAT
jgi:Spermine/spermidine synthase domain